ncbi:MAG TPA: sulfate adenylyltransferase subunit CysN [Casimicrobiaceae bacterium]
MPPDTPSPVAPPADGSGGLLRLIACGSVDDGKSTLLGRLIHEAHAIRDDQLAALKADSRKYGTRGDDIDYALLLDGLAAEREQGITIDVAYRYFTTARRRYIVADTPGHEHYTRNMVTGASTADLAIVLVDARKGLTDQTRRHSYIVSLLGVRPVVLAINKMDLVGYSQAVYDAIEAEYRAFAAALGQHDVTCIPLSAVHGDNVVASLGNTGWYRGPMLMEHLETVVVGDALASGAFRMPVQWVNRPNLDFRGFAGTIVSGSVRAGDPIDVQPSGLRSRVARIVTADGDLDVAIANQAVTLTLTDEIDVSRGDVFGSADDPCTSADQFEASLVWMDSAPMLRGRNYLMKIGTKTANATIAPLKYRVNMHTLEHVAADKLEQNDIGVCDVELDRAIAFEPYAVNRDLGGFILIDRMTNNTVGAGQLRFALRRSTNIHWQSFDIHRGVRATIKSQKPCVLWFTGLSGAGKSTIANLVEKKLHALGRHTYLLDGDNVRKGLNKDLGFTDADRVENIRRVAEVATLMADAGLIVLTAFISPFRDERAMARALLPAGEFLEIFIDTPLAVAEQRDVKGLYAKARRGQLANFTGIDSPYEAPADPEIRIDSAITRPDQAAEHIVLQLQKRGFLAA